MYAWILYYLWLVVCLFGFCWFCILRQASRWPIMTDFEQKAACIAGILGLITLLLGELTPLTAPLFGATLSQGSWLNCLLAFSVFSLLFCPWMIVQIANDSHSRRLEINPETSAIGWLVCFNQVKDCQMTAGQINHWLFRCFSLWRFENGLVVRNITIGGTGWGLELRLVLKRTAGANPQSFREGADTILSSFESDLEAAYWNHDEKQFLRNYPNSHRFREAVEVEIQSPTTFQEVRTPIDLS